MPECECLVCRFLRYVWTEWDAPEAEIALDSDGMIDFEIGDYPDTGASLVVSFEPDDKLCFAARAGNDRWHGTLAWSAGTDMPERIRRWFERTQRPLLHKCREV